jgi:hypothetical protein
MSLTVPPSISGTPNRLQTHFVKQKQKQKQKQKKEKVDNAA